MDFENYISTITSISEEEYHANQKNILLSCIKAADDNISRIFYNNFSFNMTPELKLSLKELSVLCTAYAISKIDNYNIKSTISIEYTSIAQWFKSNNNQTGPKMFRYHLTNLGLDNYYDDKDTWNKIIDTLSSETFIVGTLIKMLASSQFPIMLLLGSIEAYDVECANKVRQSWFNFNKATELAQLMTKQMDWFSEYEQNYDSLPCNLINQVKNAVELVEKCEEYVNTEDQTVTPSGASYYNNVTYRRDYHGVSALNWINSDYGAKGYNLATGISINTTTDVEINKEYTNNFGCVAKDTLILMADNTYKKIQDIKNKELIVNGHGQFSEFSGELIHTKGIKSLYSINNENPIFSLEHAIMTENGWRSLDPESSNSINPNYDVKILKKGDNIFRSLITENQTIKFYKDTVTSIEIKYFKDGIDGYDLHFREGYNSYYASNILCLLNYPEITINNIMMSIKNNLTSQECNNFYNLISHNKDLLTKVFGYSSIEAVLNKII